MPRTLRLLLVVTMILTTIPFAALSQPGTARALAPAGVTEVVTALQSLGTVVNSLAGLGGLGQPIPFTDVDPSEALNLDTLFTDALGALGAPSSLVALAAAIDAKDAANVAGSGVNVLFNNVVGNDTANTLVFNFVATRTMNLPLTFASGDVNLDGSDISVTFAMTAPIALGYDGSASNPAEKVFLTAAPVIKVSASAAVPTVTAFQSLLGFTSVGVAGNLALNVAISSTFHDPDLNGRLTMDEWSSTALGDLVTVAFADGPGNDINGNLTLDASIVPGASDAQIAWVDANLTDGPGAPVVTLNALDDFTNINATTVFGGLASATNALLSAQQAGDLQLPFLKDNLSDLFRFADPLVKFVHELGDAAVVCGPNNTVPPSGPIFGLGSGATVYCQAYTINPVSAVNWKIGATPSNGDVNTVGPNPSATASLVLGAGGMDSLSLEFRFQGEPLTTLHVARPLFLTVDQLTAKLISVAGIDTVTPAYDASKKILTYRLQKTVPVINKVVETDFGDQLKTPTGLFGLTQSGSSQITVSASAITLDITFGVILVSNLADIKAGATNSDRFFLQVNPAGNEFQADLAVGAGSNFGLEGRLAFLKVAAGGNGPIFTIGDSSDLPAAHALALNINATGITTPTLPGTDMPRIPNAILVSDLLAGGMASKISAQCEVGMSSGLGVNATVGSGTLASGNVAVSWADVFTTGTCLPNLAGITVTPDATFTSDLLSFNIDANNPLAMLSIILDAISGFSQAVDGLSGVGPLADLDVQIPIVGVSPREMLDKLEEITTAVNNIKTNPATATNPGGTLQDLEVRLEDELGITNRSLLSFELGDVGPATEKDLILRLGYNKSASIDKPLNFKLNDGGLGLVSASNGGKISFAYQAGVQFDVAIPLKPGSALADTLVLETSRASAGGSLDAPSLNFNAAVGPLDVGITGAAKLDADIVVENPSVSPLSLATWLTGVGANLTGDSQDCGTDGVNALTGQACARLNLNFGGPIGTLGFRAEDISAPDASLSSYGGWYVSVPSGLTSAISLNPLNFGLLFKILPELVTKLQGLLAQGAEDVSVPGIGDALDAGADVVGVINSQVIVPLAGIGTAVNGVTALAVENQIDAAVLALGPIVLDRAAPSGVDLGDIDVVARCGGSDCADGAAVASIDDVQVTFLIGQNVTKAPAFDIGVPGLPINVTGATSATVGWSLLVDVGLSKAEGPYIKATHTAPELNLSAAVGLLDKPGGCAADPTNPTEFPAGFSGFSPTRCLEGKLAFLSVGMHDGNTPGGVDTDDPTRVSLATTLDLQSSAGSGNLTTGNIINSVGLKPRIVASSNIDLALRTGIDDADGLPGVVGAFHLAWGFDTDSPSLGAPVVAFDSLYLDAGKFASGLLGPVVKEVRKVTSPLEPIVDFMQAEVPILKQLAELVGQEPVTVIELLNTVAGNDLDLVNTVVSFIGLANSLPVDGNLFIALGDGANLPGAFALKGDALLKGPVAPSQALPFLGAPVAGSNLSSKLTGNNNPQPPDEDGRPTTFGVKGLSFPFIDKPTQIFGMLLGQDVTIVRMDFGTMKAEVSKGKEFGIFFVGPIPLSAEVNISFSAEARFAMGYDTRGLRQVLAGGSATKLFNGIFIDDLDYNGLDVDEWKLSMRLSAEAALDIIVAEAGVYGGVDATLSGNLDDRPNPDGKLYIDEIVDKLDNPLCLFIISGKLDLFFGFYVEVDLYLWSDRWELEIIRATLLDFTTGCDENEPPNLAYIDDSGNIVLNIGTRAGDRGIQEGEVNEEFTVRQTGPMTFSVEAFGLKELVPDAPDGNKTVNMATGKVIADAAGGDDVIALISGGTGAAPAPFVLASDIEMGEGNDSFTGGDAIDDVTGGGGVDNLIGGKGNDILKGEGGDDRMDGGIGNDNLDGGNENDTVTGGPGTDTIVGQAGDDTLLGGPWTLANLDGIDTITGGIGNDNIDGGPDNDILNGDEDGIACTDDGANTGGIDSILGGPGNDTISGGFNNDFLVGNGGHVAELGDYSDNDKICGNGGNDTIDGDDDTAQHDKADWNGDGVSGGLFGGNGNDIMYGRGGNDEMFGGNNDDDMFGGNGIDKMNGEAGLDDMFGEAGNDIMNGNTENDTMAGGPDDDTMNGNENDDTMNGDAGIDIMNGNGGVDTMRGGSDFDTMHGNEAADVMFGDSGNDRMFGDAEKDTMRGGLNDDYMEGNADVDTMYGDAGQDDMIGGTGDSGDGSGAGKPDEGDFMFGNANQDVMVGDNGRITRPGGTENDLTIKRTVVLYDLASGNSNTAVAGSDDMQGDEGNDDMYGGGEDDNTTLNGNAGEDMIEGNGGSDVILGDAGQDDLIGGTSQNAGGIPDAADTIYGGSNGLALAGDFDVIAGDNASITRTQSGLGYVTDNFAPDTLGVVRRIVTLYDVATTTTPAPANSSGGDTLRGEDGFDVMYGQGSNEVGMLGGAGNDEMYGNDGNDVMLGNDGQDDIIGGTGRTKSDDPASASDGKLDGADQIFGGNQTEPGADANDFDVILGDNATVFRVLDGAGAWKVNTFNAAITRSIRHLDVGTVTNIPGVGTSAGDSLYGEDAADTMYGQGGNDTMQGNGGDDYMEGNAATDTMNGNAGNDDMAGGTGRINDDPATGTNGRLDAADTLYGDSEFDVMAGDNAILVRTLVGGQWVQNTFNAGIQHQPRILLDENSANAATVSGGDFMRGGTQDDLMYGQAGNDDMDGEAGDDFMEGNSDNDLMLGSADQDDMIGGTVNGTIWDGFDTMYGGDQGDVMAGDNATISRPLTGGLWQTDPNTLDEVRTITLLNVEVVGGPAVNPLLSGSDYMEGNAGSDRMFGQGNDDIDDDGDGLFNEDPADGKDNDLDGRESAASTQYDCADGFDNDGTGGADGADAGCSTKTDEDGGGDIMLGNAGHDFMEGNHGADFMFGNEDEDDMWGGSSSNAAGLVGAGTPPTNLRDANDIMRGGPEDDVLIGDNGLIARPVIGVGIWLRSQGPRANGGPGALPFDRVVRNVGVAQSPEAAGAFGNDWMQGNEGEDDGYGQQGNDYMEGNEGEDALLGDLGLIVSTVQTGTLQASISPPGPFFTEIIYPSGSFYRRFTLFSFTGVPAAAGNDIMLGGDDRDSIHGVDGNDILNGDGDATALNPFTGVDPNPLTVDTDKVFGDDGNDVMWGGRGDDNMWGGWGDDNLDVRPRRNTPGFADDPPLWHTYGRFDFYQGLDLIYGGWDRDALQANVAAPGPRNTDRLLDWTGGYNVFYVCPGAYGEGTITRQGNPLLLDWLRKVIDADGALNSATTGTSGFREFAYVFPGERGANSNAPHPDHPGHFTCDTGSTGPVSLVQAAPDTMHLAGISTVHTASKTKGLWNASARVSVVNVGGLPVAGATVRGEWSNAVGTSISCVTGADGACSMPSSQTVKIGVTVVLTILDVTHPTLTYEPAVNTLSKVTVAEVTDQPAPQPAPQPTDQPSQPPDAPATPNIYLPFVGNQ